MIMIEDFVTKTLIIERIDDAHLDPEDQASASALIAEGLVFLWSLYHRPEGGPRAETAKRSGAAPLRDMHLQAGEGAIRLLSPRPMIRDVESLTVCRTNDAEHRIQRPLAPQVPSIQRGRTADLTTRCVIRRRIQISINTIPLLHNLGHRPQMKAEVYPLSIRNPTKLRKPLLKQSILQINQDKS